MISIPHEGAPCNLRPFRIEDAARLHAILSDPETMRWIEPPFDLQKTIQLLQGEALVSPPRIWALTDTEDRVIGQVIFHPYDTSSYEIGWIIARSHWGRGLATAVTEALIRRCRERGIDGCVIECVPEQAVTAHIAQKCGFACAGYMSGLAVYRRKA